MQIAAAKFGGKRVTLIFFLLISLCSSRAEGVHLLPFADQTEPETDLSQLYIGDELQYQLSRIPENSSTKISFDAGQTTEPADFALALSVIARAPDLSVADPGINDPDSGTPPRWRDLLTSSTDRSPPLT